MAKVVYQMAKVVCKMEKVVCKIEKVVYKMESSIFGGDGTPYHARKLLILFRPVIPIETERKLLIN